MWVEAEGGWVGGWWGVSCDGGVSERERERTADSGTAKGSGILPEGVDALSRIAQIPFSSTYTAAKYTNFTD